MVRIATRRGDPPAKRGACQLSDERQAPRLHVGKSFPAIRFTPRGLIYSLSLLMPVGAHLMLIARPRAHTFRISPRAEGYAIAASISLPVLPLSSQAHDDSNDDHSGL